MPEKGAISVAEAGRRGGRKTRQTHGPEFYEAIGRKGGETTKERHGPDFFQKIGKKGGATVKRLVAAGKLAGGK